eukprot:TRINITY_DN39025_c0_g1_i1.p1 TRINITY_DN39025_c0_g1~~TRINITY_DN39025_c0_g1_i1.p1  ORF type:complete len:397 (-),score=71.50 TRINITY_DN39025_c0_g1_i1:612-1742(-)
MESQERKELSEQGLRRLAVRPCLYLQDGFASGEECRVLRGAIERGAHGEGSTKPQLRPDEQEVLDGLSHRIGELVDSPPHAAETPLAARKTPRVAISEAPDLFLGLHVDTFQGSRRRFVTALLYLNGDLAGGETAFPLALPSDAALNGAFAGVRASGLADVDGSSSAGSRNCKGAEHSRALAAARFLLRAGFYHTTAACTPTLGEQGYLDPPADAEAAAGCLLAFASGSLAAPYTGSTRADGGGGIPGDSKSRADGGAVAPAGDSIASVVARAPIPPGVRVEPREGRLLVFFTRTDTGEIDPYSWHGGCAVRGGTSASGLKMTAQAFKQVPPLLGCVADGEPSEEEALAAILSPYIGPRLARLERLAVDETIAVRK